jgi:NADH:ubiquinone reductase (non-electrogenic)
LTLSEFEALLSKADSTLTTLPATAQVAAQQGKYVAHVFNDRAKQPEKPVNEFHYQHFGTLAKIGGTDAVAEIGNIKSGFAFALSPTPRSLRI